MKIRIPNVDDKECYIEDKQSIVLLGANGAGKTRMSVWIDENNPELNIHRISAQKSLNMPEYVSPTELKKAEDKFLYGTTDDNRDWLKRYGKKSSRLEIVSAPSAEDIMMAVENTKDTINTFVELVSRVIEKSPKIGYAVLLLHTGVKGAEFYDKMRLSSFPGNRVRQEAEEILKGGLANFDVESYKGYKSKFNDIYREEAYALLNVIIEMLG